MGPLLLAAAGVIALTTAVAILRRFGPGYRVGRLLAAAPRASVADAIALANAGEQQYVRIDGRIDAEDEFEDANHQPLVLRRTTLMWRPRGSRGRWTTYDVSTQTVPFVVREGLAEIEVDRDALAEGLVVVTRESRGVVGDLGERAPEGVAPDAEARLVLEQVSSVEHATVVGLPRRLPDGRVVIGPGLGRPLLLSTLEGDEAMRVLAGGATGRARLVVACLATGALLIGAAAVWWLMDALGAGAAVALAASPDPSLRPGSDTRTTGGGPGLVGAPLLAILGVLGVGLASLAATLAYVRFTGARRDQGRPPGGPPPGRG